MSELSDHIRSAKLLELYGPTERNHDLSFAYGLITWVERDGADRLERTPTGFILSKGGEVIGTFPIKIPEPKPSFLETLLTVFHKDEFVREHLGVTYDGAGVFSFSRK